MYTYVIHYTKTGCRVGFAAVCFYVPTRLAYVILAHKHWENVVRLVLRLYEPDTTAFAVHVDVKSPEVFRELSEWRDKEQMEGIVEVVYIMLYNIMCYIMNCHIIS